MFQQLKQVIQQMGQGFSMQHLGEMSATADHIERRSRSFNSAGGQSRIILIASTDPPGPAFDFVAEIAMRTRSLIEVLYVAPDDDSKNTLNNLLKRLSDLSCDFQITHLSGDLLEKVSDYHSQREDVMAVVCSSSEELAEKLRPAPRSLDPAIRFIFPTVLLVSNGMIA